MGLVARIVPWRSGRPLSMRSGLPTEMGTKDCRIQRSKGTDSSSAMRRAYEKVAGSPSRHSRGQTLEHRKDGMLTLELQGSAQVSKGWPSQGGIVRGPLREKSKRHAARELPTIGREVFTPVNHLTTIRAGPRLK